jgi:SAM-dependent methyltransferase
VLNEILYTMADPDRLLDRVVDCLRPGGHVVASIWGQPGSWQLWRLLDARFQRRDITEVRSSSSGKYWQVGYYRLRTLNGAEGSRNGRRASALPRRSRATRLP